MAAPRVFVSSTCYDLQEIRDSLRVFIEDFGFEPVMSEFGDIFYEYKAHVQDACIKEIEKCHLFLLIVGNNYGSSYHKEHIFDNIPESVTLKEFKKALAVNIPKHIFINKFVHYDYKNYQRILRQSLKIYFDSHEVADENIEEKILEVRKALDSKYYFPQASYKYIFHFLDLIEDLKINNAIYPFETFPKIKEQLKKQWAGFMYERLTNDQTVSTQVIEKLSLKLDKVENLLQKIVTSKSDKEGKISLDIEKISSSIAYNQLAKVQEMLEQILYNIMYSGTDLRGEIVGDIGKKEILSWLDGLENTLKKYKWSKYLPFEKLWEGFEFDINDGTDIPYSEVLKLNSLYKNIPSKESESFVDTVLLKLQCMIITEDEYSCRHQQQRPF